MFEFAAVGIALVEMDGHPVGSNPALERMLAYGTAELREMAFTEFTHRDDASPTGTCSRSLSPVRATTTRYTSAT